MRKWICNNEETNEELKVGIYCMSYNRPNTTTTFKLFKENTVYVVRDTQLDDYKNNGIENIISFPDEEINCASKTIKKILSYAQEDVIIILDDDILKISIVKDKVEELKNIDDILKEIYNIAQIMYDLDIGFASNSLSMPLKTYAQEFSFITYGSYIKFFNKRRFRAKIDGELEYAVDIDWCLQELLINRITLKADYLYCSGLPQETTTGGCNEKTMKQKQDCFLKLKLKWGSYVKENKNNPAKVRISIKR